MTEEQEKVTGFVCASGHYFWIEWIWPAPPIICPVCGNRELNPTNTGVVIQDKQ